MAINPLHECFVTQTSHVTPEVFLLSVLLTHTDHLWSKNQKDSRITRTYTQYQIPILFSGHIFVTHILERKVKYLSSLQMRAKGRETAGKTVLSTIALQDKKLQMLLSGFLHTIVWNQEIINDIFESAIHFLVSSALKVQSIKYTENDIH